MNEQISNIANVLIALAALGTVAIAWFGLRSWRHEMKERNDYELARRIMRACFEVRDSFWRIRNPMSQISFEESLTREGMDQHTIEEFLSRWASIDEPMQKFEVEILESEVLWGTDLVQPRINMRLVVGELQDAIQEKFDNIRTKAEISTKENKRLRNMLYAVPGSDDPLSKKMISVLKEFEDYCRPKLDK